MKKLIWTVWILITFAIAGFYGYTMFVAEQKDALLIGDASHGHFQIELACDACHTEPFGGKEILQNACVDCHQEELKQAHDSHPKKKFNDPRNADLLEIIDARYCVSCHTEHQEEQTHPMGVTVAEDYCFHCHENVGEERESHAGLTFDTCASAGCHNYHDNKALYDTFLAENSGGEWLNEMARIADRSAAKATSEKKIKVSNNAALEQLVAEKMAAYPEALEEHQNSSHAAAGLECSNCHIDQTNSPKPVWIEKPNVAQCETCHSKETEGYLAGKHGMRLSQGMTTYIGEMLTEDKAPKFTSAAQNSFGLSDQDIQHGCTTCHGAHSFDAEQAAVSSCLNCHSDEHSLAYEKSPHANVVEASKNKGLIDFSDASDAAQNVTCATCHMPRYEYTKAGTKVVGVEHNQNMNLRPNEKMIRSVCLDCHSLEFSIDALADPALIKNNFNGQPSEHIPSVDWAVKRHKE